MTESKEKIDRINQLWQRDLKFHEAFAEVRKVYLYQRNVGQIIDQLGHFINLESELKDIRLLIEDDNNLEQVFSRISNLTDLRDNVMSKLDKKSGDLTTGCHAPAKAGHPVAKTGIARRTGSSAFADDDSRAS